MIDGWVYTWIIIPVLIFLARIIDVSIGTFRVILISKGIKKIAAFLGFFEVLIWLLATQQILVNMTNWIMYVAYAGGFAAGTYVGIYIEERVSIGKVVLRVILRKNANKIINKLRRAKFRITTMDARGSKKRFKVLFMTMKRKDLQKAIAIIKKHNPKAFYTVEDIRFANSEKVPKTEGKRKFFRLLTKKF